MRVLNDHAMANERTEKCGEGEMCDGTGLESRKAAANVHCTVHPPLSLSRRLSRGLLGISPTTLGSSRSVSAPETAETAENEVILDSLSAASTDIRGW